MKINTVQDLFLNALQSVYDAEKQLTQAIPELAQGACCPQLREAFEQHLRETKEHVGRCEQIFKRIGEQPQTQPNVVLEQMRQEARHIIENTPQCEIRDAALIVAGNQVEHYEISAYGSLRNFAELLGYNDVVDILQKTLDEEKRADAKLTELADSQVNIQALHKSAAAMAIAY
jgi:ferritin-like metal-binding protein YciE